MRGLALGVVAAVIAWISTPELGAAGNVTISFRVVCADGPLPTDLRFLATPGAPPSALRFVPDVRSAMLSYRGPESLTFFREVKSQTGPSVRVKVTSVMVPLATRQALLVFLPGGDSSGLEEYHVVLIEEPEARLVRSSIRFLNLSDAQLLVKVDTQNRELAAWRFEDFRFRVKQVGRVPYGLAVMHDTEWEVVIDSDLVLGAQRSYLMLLLPPLEPDSRRVRLKLLEE